MNETISVQGNCSRADQMEDRMSNLDDRNLEITQLEVNKGKRMKKSKESLHDDLWDSIKHTTISIIGVQRRKREGGIRKFI